MIVVILCLIPSAGHGFDFTVLGKHVLVSDNPEQLEVIKRYHGLLKGKVIAVGSDVTRVSVGDYVLFNSQSYPAVEKEKRTFLVVLEENIFMSVIPAQP